MRVKLIGYTQPTEEFKSESGIEDIRDLIAYCARVSNPSNQMNSETASRLLDYCKKNSHWSIFEMASATMEIETTRDIARQILRHRSFSFQEFSQRYAKPTDMGYPFELREARLQDPKNRQNSVELNLEDLGKGGEGSGQTSEERLALQWVQKQKEVIAVCADVYKWAIENGVAKEQARAVLPEGLTKSRMYMSGTIRSWIHFIELRSANGTQKEHMEIAKACAQAISQIYKIE